MSFSVRPAVLADAEAIARVHVASWRVAYAGLMPEVVLAAFTFDKREAAWRAILAREAAEARTFVATTENVIGFASTGPARDTDASRSSSELYALYLDPASWDLGVGRALFAAAAADLGERGCTAVTAWVLEGNVRARRFYEAAGMRLDGGFKVEVEEGAELRHLRYALPLAKLAG